MLKRESSAIHYQHRYPVSGRDLLSYGYKYGAPWAEDRRALERAFYAVDRSRSNPERGWSSYSSARDRQRFPSSGSHEFAVSAGGRRQKESNEHDAQSLVDAMGLVKIGEGTSHVSTRGGSNGSYFGDRSRSNASLRAAGNKDYDVAGSSDIYRTYREERYRPSHTGSGSSFGDFEQKGKTRAVPGNLGGRASTNYPVSRRPESYHSNLNYGRTSPAINEPFHERDTVHSRLNVAKSRPYSQWDQNYGSYEYRSYHGSMVSPNYGYDYSYEYDDDYSESGSSDYSGSYPSPRAYVNSIYEDIPQSYDVTSVCGSIRSDEEFYDIEEQ